MVLFSSDSAYDSDAYDPVKLDCRRRKRKPKNKPGIVIGWFFRFCLRLRQSSFYWIISVGVISGIGRKWNRSDSSDSDSVELMTPLATPIFDFH